MRLIDADAIPYREIWREDWLHNAGKYQQGVFRDEIEDMPTVDAAPVRRGKWIHEVRYTIDSLHSYQQYRCSECDMTYITNTKYCPNCGARMVEDE